MTSATTSGTVDHLFTTDVWLQQGSETAPLSKSEAKQRLSALADEVAAEARITVEFSHVDWEPKHVELIAADRADYVGWCFTRRAAGTTDESYADSGAVLLYDPRAGSSAVSVPGLPWGRALTIRPRVGLSVIAPGWLSASVLPVADNDVIGVTTARIWLS